MKLSEAGLSFIANEEGFVDHVYLDQVGVATIGYGHVVRAGETFMATITVAQGRAILAQDVSAVEDALSALVTVPLTQPQFDALVSLAFNIGAAAFSSSTLLKLLNIGDYAGAAEQFPVWRMGGGGVLPVLVRRRARERTMFLTSAPTTWLGTAEQPDLRDPNASELDGEG